MDPVRKPRMRGYHRDRDALVTKLDRLFHPDSIAIVGVPRGLKTGKLFLLALLDQGYPGKIYPVHPEATDIDGLKAYPSVSAVPGPVDLAIVLVPQEQTLGVVEEWRRARGHRLTGEDLLPLIQDCPHLMVAGSGMSGRPIAPPGLKERFL